MLRYPVSPDNQEGLSPHDVFKDYSRLDGFAAGHAHVSRLAALQHDTGNPWRHMPNSLVTVTSPNLRRLQSMMVLWKMMIPYFATPRRSDA